MTDQVTRRIPTAASTAAMQSDQRCSHVISSCFDIMDQSDMEAAMKKSESDTELLSGNVINYSSNTLTRSKKVSNLEKTEDDDNVRIREKPGRNQSIASKQINRAFDFLEDYGVDSAEIDISRIPENPSEEDSLNLSPDNNENIDQSDKKLLIREHHNNSSVTSEICFNKGSTNLSNISSDCKPGTIENKDLRKEHKNSSSQLLKDTHHELCVNMNLPQNENYTNIRSEHNLSAERMKNNNMQAMSSLTQIDLQNNDISKELGSQCSEKENLNKNSTESSLVQPANSSVHNLENSGTTSPQMSSKSSKIPEKEGLEQGYIQSNTFNCKASSNNITVEKRSSSEVSAEDKKDEIDLAAVASGAACAATQYSDQCDNDECCAEDLNLKPLPTSLSDPSVPSLMEEEPKPNYLIQGGMSLRRGGRRANKHLMNGRGTVDYSDEDSSDEDSG